MENKEQGQTHIIVKNMVCPRCIETVKSVFDTHGESPLSVALGVVQLQRPLTTETFRKVEDDLENHGFEILKDQKAQLIGKMKSLVVELIHYEQDDLKHLNFSTYLSERLLHDYAYLSRLFSSVEGITLERYIVKQKIEKVKELLFYNELTLSEIAHRLHYSSVAHLSAQFKKETGMSPSTFKKNNKPSRNSLDAL